MEQRLQNQSLVKSEENDHDRDRDNGLCIGAVSGSAHSTGTTPMSFPRGLEPTLSLPPASPPSNCHSHVPTNGPHYTKGARYDPSSTNTSSPMSLQSILNPSNDGPVSKSIHPCTSLKALRSTPFVQILSSLEPRYSAASFSSPLPHTDLPATSNNSIGIKLPRLITSPMLATISKDKPSPSKLRSPFPLTPHPIITNLHDALAEVDRLRERCRASFEYIGILERANESLRMNRNMDDVTTIQRSVSTMVSPVSPTTRTWSKLR